MIDYEKMMTHVKSHQFPLVFATISGAHLYGFPSPDSDFDLRGVHLLPLKTVLSLDDGQQTVEKEGIYDGLEIDFVTHDAAKFFGLMLKRNGYVLEQLLSPLVVFTTPEHEELKVIATRCITRHHAYHYLGFAATQWRLFEKESPPRVKPLLYTFRVLLTGIHLMKTGEVQANLCILNESAKLSYLNELIHRKLTGAGIHAEHCTHHRNSDERFDQTITQLFKVLNKRLFSAGERVFFLGTCIRHSASNFDLT